MTRNSIQQQTHTEGNRQAMPGEFIAMSSCPVTAQHQGAGGLVPLNSSLISHSVARAFGLPGRAAPTPSSTLIGLQSKAFFEEHQNNESNVRASEPGADKMLTDAQQKNHQREDEHRFRSQTQRRVHPRPTKNMSNSSMLELSADQGADEQEPMQADDDQAPVVSPDNTQPSAAVNSSKASAGRPKQHTSQQQSTGTGSQQQAGKTSQNQSQPEQHPGASTMSFGSQGTLPFSQSQPLQGSSFPGATAFPGLGQQGFNPAGMLGTYPGQNPAAQLPFGLYGSLPAVPTPYMAEYAASILRQYHSQQPQSAGNTMSGGGVFGNPTGGGGAGGPGISNGSFEGAGYGAGGGTTRNRDARDVDMMMDDDGKDGDGARAIKRPRLVWTPQLHKRFEEAIVKLGDAKAVPKNIMQEMNVEGLTRENVASHLQKYRLQKQARDGPGMPGCAAGATTTTTDTTSNTQSDGR